MLIINQFILGQPISFSIILYACKINVEFVIIHINIY